MSSHPEMAVQEPLTDVKPTERDWQFGRVGMGSIPFRTYFTRCTDKVVCDVHFPDVRTRDVADEEAYECFSNAAVIKNAAALFRNCVERAEAGDEAAKMLLMDINSDYEELRRPYDVARDEAEQEEYEAQFAQDRADENWVRRGTRMRLAA